MVGILFLRKTRDLFTARQTSTLNRVRKTTSRTAWECT